MLKEIKIVIIGNGFGGIYALRNLHNHFHKHKHVRLSLVGQKNYFLFTPLLHEVATGGISPENIIEPIRKVFGCCLDRFYLGKANLIDTTTKTVHVGKENLSYDYLILAPGAETNFFGIPGADKYSFTLKTLDDAIKIKNHLVAQIERASHILDADERRKILSFVVVGGGPSGVELVAEMHELILSTFSKYYSRALIKDVSVTLVQRDAELLPQFGSKIRRKSIKILEKKGIRVMISTHATEVGEDYVITNTDEKILTETIVWVAGIKPSPLNFDIPVLRAKDDRIVVNEFLQLTEHKEIFALGDVALIQDGEHFVPALAQAAEKEAKSVAKNLYRLVKNKELKPFEYKSSGSLVSFGQHMAAGEIAHITFMGYLTWWLWRTVYLTKMISPKKKVRVAVDWALNIFSPRDISQI